MNELKVYTQDPYSWNAVSLKRMNQKKDKPLPSPVAAALDANCNMVGKFLGVDTKHEWNQYYDKVYFLTKWAEEKTGSTDINKVIDFLKDEINKSTQMHPKRIDDLFIQYKLDQLKNPKEKKEVKKEENKFTFEFTIKGGELNGSKE